MTNLKRISTKVSSCGQQSRFTCLARAEALLFSGDADGARATYAKYAGTHGSPKSFATQALRELDRYHAAGINAAGEAPIDAWLRTL